MEATVQPGAIAPEQAPAPFAPQPGEPPHLFIEMGVVLRELCTINTAAGVITPATIRATALVGRFEALGYGLGETLFVLRARDALAAETVMHWIAKASVAGVRREKIVDAVRVAAAMEKYPERRLPD